METVLNLPAIVSHPSINCVQYSTDGQILIVTKGALYILTPDLGVNIDLLSAIKANQPSHGSSKSIAWFRTMIETEKPLAQNWPSNSQEWEAVAFGALDPALRSVACSPAHVTINAGSVIATLDSNMQLLLWTASKNHLRGEWIKVEPSTSLPESVLTRIQRLDVTDFLREYYSSHKFSSVLAKTLEFQVTSIAWSAQANFSISPAPAVNGSIFAAGTRAGSLTLFRFSETEDGNGYLDSISHVTVGNSWVNHCAWSQWLSSTPGSCMAWISCSLANGSVVIVEVSQTLVTSDSGSGFGPHFTIQTAAALKEADSFVVDKRGLTALRWIDVPGKTPLLIHCKPGTVHLFSFPSPDFDWSGHVTITLQTQKTSDHSSALYPTSGIAYHHKHDALVISLFDGSFHVIKNVCTAPEYITSGDAALTSKKMSSAARSLFVRAEGRELQKPDANRISGMISLDRGWTYAWVHEACRPSDFSYKHEAKHNSMFVVVELTETIEDDAFMTVIAQILNTATAASGQAPIFTLLPAFLQLSGGERLNRILPRVLQILESDVPQDSTEVIVSPWTGALTPDMLSSFREQLMTQLFGWDSLAILRLRLATADFCLKNLKDAESQNTCRKVAQMLLNAISQKVLQIIMKFCAAVVNVLTPNDMPFAFRMIRQSSLSGLPPDLRSQGQELAAIITGLGQQDTGAPFEYGADEPCPACHIPIPLQSITSAVCEKGHIWTRCSITSFILSTPKVRTCLGCARKAFLPPAPSMLVSLPQAARSWVVEELLHAARRCLFCGNRFVTII